MNHCRRVVNMLVDVKTGEFSLLRDQCGQCLLMGRAYLQASPLSITVLMSRLMTTTGMSSCKINPWPSAIRLQVLWLI